MALSVAIWAGEASAEQPSGSSQISAQPVFLLSERELGAGIKVCFLSNGLQVRLPSEKVCPYPLKAPPLATEQQPAPAPAAPAIAEANKPAVTDTPKLAEQPKTPSPPPQSLSAASPNAIVKLQEPPQQKLPIQRVISQPIVQPVAPLHATNASSKTQANVEGSGTEHQDIIEDEIADKAIRRCERIGFKVGTEPFKVCALDQIKILSGLRP